jgi:hypothetical protein
MSTELDNFFIDMSFFSNTQAELDLDNPFRDMLLFHLLILLSFISFLNSPLDLNGNGKVAFFIGSSFIPLFFE